MVCAHASDILFHDALSPHRIEQIVKQLTCLIFNKLKDKQDAPATV